MLEVDQVVEGWLSHHEFMQNVCCVKNAKPNKRSIEICKMVPQDVAGGYKYHVHGDTHVDI